MLTPMKTMSLTETAAALRCTREWLWSLRKRGLIKFRYNSKTGRAFTTQVAVERYLKRVVGHGPGARTSTASQMPGGGQS